MPNVREKRRNVEGTRKMRDFWRKSKLYNNVFYGLNWPITKLIHTDTDPNNFSIWRTLARNISEKHFPRLIVTLSHPIIFLVHNLHWFITSSFKKAVWWLLIHSDLITTLWIDYLMFGEHVRFLYTTCKRL